ncbi:MAG: flavin reductase family protein [Pseudomonadota bacterium]
MKFNDFNYYDYFDKFCCALNKGGLFLVVNDPDGKPNPMTIGWATIGTIWYKPIMTVLVRPSRHTFSLIEKNENFTVCVPGEDKLNEELAFCGTKSGRDFDKVKECNFEMEKGRLENTSIIKGCQIFYECKTVHKNDVLKPELESNIISKYYPEGDFHRIYYGEIVHSYIKN